jgi:hypothetical protein
LTAWLGAKLARREIRAERKRGNEVLRFLDGKKSFLFILAFIVSGIVQALTGADISTLIDAGLRAMDWQDPVAIAEAKGLATQAVPLLLALWASGSSLLKMAKQYKAGASIAALGTPVGVVKAAIANGSLAVMAPAPGSAPGSVMLKVDDIAVVARPVAPAPKIVPDPITMSR